jgi:hypothetical protein
MNEKNERPVFEWCKAFDLDGEFFKTLKKLEQGDLEAFLRPTYDEVSDHILKDPGIYEFYLKITKVN